MAFLKDIAVFFRFATKANRYERLFMMSDRELSQRGYDRDRLVRGYLYGLGAI